MENPQIVTEVMAAIEELYGLPPMEDWFDALGIIACNLDDNDLDSARVALRELQAECAREENSEYSLAKRIRALAIGDDLNDAHTAVTSIESDISDALGEIHNALKKVLSFA